MIKFSMKEKLKDKLSCLSDLIDKIRKRVCLIYKLLEKYRRKRQKNSFSRQKRKNSKFKCIIYVINQIVFMTKKLIQIKYQSATLTPFLV